MDKSKKRNLDEQTLRRAKQTLRTPPKPHDETKLGKGLKRPDNPKTRPASKGRVHKGRTRT